MEPAITSSLDGLKPLMLVDDAHTSHKVTHSLLRVVGVRNSH